MRVTNATQNASVELAGDFVESYEQMRDELQALVDSFDKSVSTTDPMLVSARKVLANAKNFAIVRCP